MQAIDPVFEELEEMELFELLLKIVELVEVEVELVKVEEQDCHILFLLEEFDRHNLNNAMEVSLEEFELEL